MNGILGNGYLSKDNELDQVCGYVRNDARYLLALFSSLDSLYDGFNSEIFGILISS